MAMISLGLDDLAAVQTLEQRAHPLPASNAVLRDCLRQYQCWGLRDNAQLLAFIIWQQGPFELQIFNIAVDPEQRRRGLARRLLGHAAEYAQAQQLDSVFLEVRRSNAAAISLYDACGFHEVGCRRAYYPQSERGGAEDALLMARPIF